MIRATDLEEARLHGGELTLRWKAPYEMTVGIMTAQEFHEMLWDFDAAISTVEQQFLPDDHRHKLVAAMRKQWFP